MAKKVITATHIDTASHGYLSVSKKDFALLQIPATEITSYSGHTLTRLYLEEDCDASKFMKYAEKAGIKVNVKSGYNPKFHIRHNYNPDLLNYVPEVGDEVELRNGETVRIAVVDSDGITVRRFGSGQYRIPLSNPFEYIKSAKKLKQILEEVNKDIKTAFQQ